MGCFLKYIEIENFKSYFGLHRIGPLGRFTVIVGLNGSGKSNLMDAVSFVMGANAQHLRVRRLPDLIYGASFGGPVSNTACVSAVFELEDGTSKTFTRQINGASSEYSINYQGVSSVKYHKELSLMEINIKAKNFLVFQGTIERIAVKNPKEICELFEEMSGSVSLKEEYERLSKELCTAQDRLSYISGKKRKINALKEAATKEIVDGKCYKQLCDQLSDMKREQKLFQLLWCDKELKNLNNELVFKEREEVEALQLKNGCESNQTGLKTTRSGLINNLIQLENEIDQNEIKLKKKQPEFIKLNSKHLHKEKKLHAAVKLLEQARKAEIFNNEVIEQLNRDMAEVDEAIEAHPDETIGQYEMDEYRRLKEECKMKNGTHVQEMTMRKQDQIVHQNKYDHVSRLRKETEARLNDRRREREDIEEQLNKLDGLIKQNQAEHDELKTLEENSHKNVESTKQLIAKYKKELADQRAALSNAEIDASFELQRKKKEELVVKLRKEFPGVHDRLVNLCTPRQKRLHTAIAKVMGPDMDSIVVDRRETALKCVKFLQENKYGMEKFIPLDKIDAPALRVRLREELKGSGLRLLYDELEFDPAFEKVVRFSTRNVLVCECQEFAANVAYGRLDGQRYSVVSLNGRFFQGNGLVSGTSQDTAKRARQWDRKEVVARRKRVAELEEKLRAELERDVSPDTWSIRRKGVATRLGRMKSDRIEKENNLGAVNSEIEKLEGLFRDYGAQAEELENAIKAREGKIKEIAEKMSEKENEVFAGFCQRFHVANLREFEENILRQQEEHMKRRNELIKQRNRIEQQLNYQITKQTQIESNIERWRRAVEHDEKELNETKESAEEMSELMSKMQEELDEQKKQRDSLKKDLADVDEEIVKARKDLKRATDRAEAIRKQVAETKWKIYLKRFERHLALSRAKMDGVKLPLSEGSMDDVDETVGSPTTFESLSTQSSIFSSSSDGSDTQPNTQSMFAREDNIQLDYSGLPRELVEIEDSASAKKELDRLEEEMEAFLVKFEALQAPDMRARDKLREVSEKFNEVNEEYRDVALMTKRLRKAFNEVKQQRLQLFKACFDHVCEQIDGIYKGLTGSQSAQAYLVTEANDEPYLGGLLYSCVAPGKRFQLMTHLSGGEKTVAALALLFAIHSRQSSPFFVLDEIDAALDGENVRRVTEYFRSKKNDVQIIQISLKERVCERADVAVGVSPDPREERLKSKISVVDMESEYSRNVTNAGLAV